MSDVLMKCGCTAHATCSRKDGVKLDQPIPACVIHDCYDVADEKPDLAGRKARCTYMGSCRARRGINSYRPGKEKPDYGTFDDAGHGVAPSSFDLPFFHHNPDKPHDDYYCGCFGWE